MKHEVVAPLIVADYIKFTNQIKNGKSKQIRLKLSEARDKLWGFMTTDAQWLTVDILSNQVKYKVQVDE